MKQESKKARELSAKMWPIIQRNCSLREAYLRVAQATDKHIKANSVKLQALWKELQAIDPEYRDLSNNPWDVFKDPKIIDIHRDIMGDKDK